MRTIRCGAATITCCGSAADARAATAGRPFALLLPATSTALRPWLLAVLGDLMATCAEVHCVGPDADALDSAVEDLRIARAAFEIGVQSRPDARSGCAAFVEAAALHDGGGVALVADDGELAAMLARAAEELDAWQRRRRDPADDERGEWFIELVRRIERRPGLFVGATDVRSLHGFAAGYHLALLDAGREVSCGTEMAFARWLAAAPEVRVAGVDAAQRPWWEVVEALDPSPGNVVTFVRLFHRFLAARGRDERST